MRNEEKQQWISAYIDGELSSDDQRMVERWLEEDASDRAFHVEIRELRDWVQRQRMPSEPLSDASANIMAAIGAVRAPWEEQAPGGTGAATTIAPTVTATAAWIPQAALAIAAAFAVMIYVIPNGDDGQNKPIQGIAQAPNAPNAPNGPNAGASNDPNTQTTPDTLGGSPDTSNNSEFVAATPASFIVVHVELTKKGVERDSVSIALLQAGIGEANSVPVDPTLENALLQSTVFSANTKPAGKTPPADSKKEKSKSKSPTKLEGMVYTVLTGPQLDLVFDYLAKEKGNDAVTNLGIDVAFLTNDVSLFKLLHGTAEDEFQITSTTPDSPASKPKTSKSPESEPTLRLRSQQLVLTDTLRSRLGNNLKLLSGASAAMLQSFMANSANENDSGQKANPNDGDDAPKTDVVVGSAAQREAMAAQTSGVLIIVRSQK